MPALTSSHKRTRRSSRRARCSDEGENWTVYVVKDGRAEIKDIKLLRRSGRLAAVASGLAAGKSVVVYPGDRVASGVRVEVRQAGDSR